MTFDNESINVNYSKLFSYFYSTIILFLLYMDSICQTSLSHCSKLIVYADDILLLHPVSCHNNFHTAQCDLDCIVSNIMSIHLVINPTKSKYMLFSLCPNSLPSYPSQALPSNKYRVFVI